MNQGSGGFMPISVQLGADFASNGIGPFEATSFQWGPQHASSSPNPLPTQAQASDVVITKNTDGNSTALMQACVTGTVFDTATLTFTKSDQDSPVPYLVLKLSSTVVASISTNVTDDGPSEGVDLNFISVAFENLAAGAAAGTP